MKKVNSLAVYCIISVVYFASCFLLPSISSEIYGQSSSSLSSSISLPSAENDDNIVKQQVDTFNNPKIPNQYIVVFKDNVKNPNYLINQLVKKIEKSTFKDLDISNIFQNSIKASVIKINTQSELDKIKQDPNVKYVEQDQKIQSFAQTLPKGINRIDADQSFTKSGDGFGSVNIDIAILDTGIYNHQDLNIFSKKDFTGTSYLANDGNGHGTHVAGTAAAKDDTVGVVGVAPGARLWNLKVLDDSGSGSISSLISAIDYVTANANQIEVVNLSLGCQCTSSALNTAINSAVNAGVTFVVAAGNSGINAASYSPANHPNVIAVSAIVDTDGKCGGLGGSSTYGKDDSLASFSNYGNVVDMAAPGVNIYSTYKSSYATLSGTSMATPHVSGSVALYLSSHPDALPSEVSNTIKNLGTNPGTLCDGQGKGYFTGDKDTSAERLLYVRNIDSSVTSNPEVCNDAKDNDGDGLIDGEDLDCPTVKEICNNGLDDDRDGSKDAADSDCQQATGYHYEPFFTTTGSDRIDVADTQKLHLSSFTIATWFKTTANFVGKGIEVNKGGLGPESIGNNLNYGIWLDSSERLVGGFETTGGANKWITSTNTYNDGQWHHGVVTFDNPNNIVRLFVDGVQIRTLSTSTNPDNTGTKPLRIAENVQSLGQDAFIGQLDEIGVWNRALTNSEITSLMNTGVFPSSGIVYNNSFGP